MTEGIDRPPLQAADVPLSEAVRRFVDPLVLQRYDELSAQIAAWPQPGTAGYRQGWPDQDPRSRQYLAGLRAPILAARADAHKAVISDLRQQLQDGRLIASGLALPLTPSSRRTDIASTLWTVLAMRPSSGEVVGKGLRMMQVRIRQARQPKVAGTAQQPNGPAGEETKRPGPKSIMPEIETEMRVRAERGKLKEGITDACRALEKWARSKHPNHPRVPKAKSIQNVLGKLYYELRQLSDTRI